jgi:hypothetical protein
MLDPEDTAAAEETPAQWAASGKGKVDVVVIKAVYFCTSKATTFVPVLLHQKVN